MKTFTPYEVLFGFNDVWHFINEANDRRKDQIPLAQFFDETDKKRKWSLINPGSLLSSAYMYFLYGHEKKLLNKFPTKEEAQGFVDKFTVRHANPLEDKKYTDKGYTGKATYIKVHVRNALAHCEYEVQVRTDSGKAEKDGDYYLYFFRKKDTTDEIVIEIPLISFANVVQKMGQVTFSKLCDVQNAKK